mgnify:CR=1 FL=1
MKYDNDLETLFCAITHMHMTCAKKEFDKRGIKPVGHPPILFILRHESENMAASQKKIADKLGISPPTVAISIKRMEKAGLVHKIADESDLRRNLITLTDKGLKQVDETKTVLEKIDESMFRGLTEEEQAQLKTLFLRIVSNLEAMGAQPPGNLKKEGF